MDPLGSSPLIAAPALTYGRSVTSNSSQNYGQNREREYHDCSDDEDDHDNGDNGADAGFEYDVDVVVRAEFG